MKTEDASELSPPMTEITYAIREDRMPPIAYENMTDLQREAVADIMAGPRGEVRGPYWPILRSPGLMMALQKVGEYTRYQCKLDQRINEMATMMAARELTQQYIWNTHYGKLIKAGVKPAVAEAIAEGRRPEEMAQDEAVLYDFLVELFARKSVSDPTYARAVEMFGEEGVIDIVGVVGYYGLLGMVMNVARTPLRDSRPLPLIPMPMQLRCDMPGVVSASNYVLSASQRREFDAVRGGT